jgi:hypothetical protein
MFLKKKEGLFKKRHEKNKNIQYSGAWTVDVPNSKTKAVSTSTTMHEAG